MDWAGRAIEIASSLSLEEFIKQNIFIPLKMTSTTFSPSPEAMSGSMEMAWRDRQTMALRAGPNPWTYPAVDDCGGVGLYSTAADYARLLSALLVGGGPILKQSSIDEIMKSQLVDPKYFLEIIHGPGRAHLGQTWPAGADATFGLSASVCLEDFEGRRKKGSANWSGMPGCHAVSAFISLSSVADYADVLI